MKLINQFQVGSFYFKHFTDMFRFPGCNRNFTGNPYQSEIIDEDYDNAAASENICCRNCLNSDRDAMIVLCDECDAAYHMDTCLDTPLG